MADAKTSGKLIAGALATVLSAASLGPASAEEVPTQGVVWTQELEELRQANEAASAYAAEHGLAILLHVGLDIQNHEQSEALLQWVKDDFAKRFAAEGFDVGIFPSLNDAQGSGLVYHLAGQLYTPSSDEDALLNLQAASQLVADVSEQARIAMELQALSASLSDPSPQPEG